MRKEEFRSIIQVTCTCFKYTSTGVEWYDSISTVICEILMRVNKFGFRVRAENTQHFVCVCVCWCLIRFGFTSSYLVFRELQRKGNNKYWVISFSCWWIQCMWGERRLSIRQMSHEWWENILNICLAERNKEKWQSGGEKWKKCCSFYLVIPSSKNWFPKENLEETNSCKLLWKIGYCQCFDDIHSKVRVREDKENCTTKAGSATRNMLRQGTFTCAWTA